MSAVFWVNTGIVIITLIFLVFFIPDVIKHKKDLNDGGVKKGVKCSVISMVTLFFDTLGIGAYAPMTACYKNLKVVNDRLIPGTLNASCPVPTAFVAIAFITAVEVQILTLVVTIAASTVGAFLGAGIVAKLPINKVRIGIGCALIIVSMVILTGVLGLMPVGGYATGLYGASLVIAGVVCFILGALMTIGVGAYAPTMATVYLLGLSPLVAFPIMMGACAYLIPAAGMRFVKEGAYDRKAALITNTIGNIGTATALIIVVTLPLTALRWLVICVIIYTGIIMLRDGIRKKTDEEKVDDGAVAAT